MSIVCNTIKNYSNMRCGYCCSKKPKQPVGNSESEGILSDNCAIRVGYCVTVVVVEMGPRQVTREQRSGVNEHGVAGDPFPSVPPTFPSPIWKDLRSGGQSL